MIYCNAIIKETMEEKLKEIIKNEVFVTNERQKILSLSGNEIKWIFDFRKILLSPRHINLIADIFWEKYKNQYPFQICGLEVAAIPLVTAIVMKSIQKQRPVNGFFIRKSRKKSGLLQMIEGKINDKKIIVVDDLINSGDSVMLQVTVLDSLGKKISEVFTIIHYRELAYYYFLRERGIVLSSLFPVIDFGLEFIKTKPGEKFLGDAFEVKWYFKSENPNYFYVVPKSSPVLDKNKIYFGSDSGNFWALNQNDGSIAWKYRVGLHAKGKSIFSAPAIDGDTVYFGAYDGNVYALDTKTGKRKWVFMEADWIGSSPVLALDLGLLFIGLEFGLWKKQGGIVALDIKTGEKKWEQVTSEYTHGSPAYLKSRQVVAIGSNDSVAYLYNAKTGKLLWNLQTKGEIKASFAFDEKRGRVLFGSFDKNLYVVDIKTGKIIFVYKTECGIYSTPIVHKDTVYFSSLDKRLYSVSLKTGELNWIFQTRGRIFASPVIINDNIYIGSNDGKLYEVSPHTGEMTGSFQTAERITNKIAYNEKTRRFFLLTFTNEIYCLKKQKGA